MGGLVAPKVARELRNVVAHISMASAPPSGVFAGSKMLGYIPPHLQSIFGCKPVELDYPTVASLFYNRGSAVEAVDGYTRLCPESGRVIREIILMKHAMPKLDCPVLSIAGRYDVITPHQRKLSHQLGAKEDNIVVMNSDHMLPKPSTSRELGYIIGGWVANGFRAATEMRQAA
jgi:pimeloyl-ACP methyl ester carboxylesterase